MAATPAVADDGREERPTLRLVQAQFMAMVPLRFFRWKLPIEQVQPPTPSQARTLLHHVSLPNCWGVRTSVLDGEDKGKAVFELEDQQELLQMTVHHPLIMRYPTSLSYRQAFLKHIIQQCEDAGQEVCDELYEVYTSLLVSTLEPTSPCCYKTYTLPCGKTVVLREATQIISHGTTGLRTWEAGLCLAEWAVEHSALFEQKTVLELGSGMGLTGLVISSCCSPAHYIYSDCHPNVLANLWENLVLNCKLREEGGGSVNGSKMSVMCLDWASVTQEELQSLAPDVIIASDVVFDNELVEYFVSLLLKAMHPPPGGRSGPVAYVASTIRNQDTYDFYVRKLEEAGICSEDLSLGSTAVFFYDRQQTMKIHKLWISDEIR
ncbi:protein-lysine N-methyltransferase EEF2KMT-like isoform X3 [Branchiostoma floridae]|uniref:Protein-lysine N-methyltransferase EEF2KMT-like isoform X3 n=1 Tax=Branchiostoma floridae TaxID=7739 RepID=A0A9J7M7W1_BRAFL|nr:protein-lysine N-methyltransferase EEF2KMT-like isoform X3 [Branchiostoma floridae]